MFGTPRLGNEVSLEDGDFSQDACCMPVLSSGYADVSWIVGLCIFNELCDGTLEEVGVKAELENRSLLLLFM